MIVNRVKFSSGSLAECEDVDSEESHPQLRKQKKQELQTFRSFLEQQQEADFNIFVKFDNHIKSFCHYNIKQRLITDYASTSNQ